MRTIQSKLRILIGNDGIFTINFMSVNITIRRQTLASMNDYLARAIQDEKKHRGQLKIFVERAWK